VDNFNNFGKLIPLELKKVNISLPVLSYNEYLCIILFSRSSIEDL